MKKNFERMLKIFQTSSTHDELESSGTGHTVTKKIMELYNDKM
jgi:light-regulated signal transduction histidine kinase (bacteriophytochrome)